MWGCPSRSDSFANSLGGTPPHPPSGSYEALRLLRKTGLILPVLGCWRLVRFGTAAGRVRGCLSRSDSCANSLGKTPPDPTSGSYEALRLFRKTGLILPVLGCWRFVRFGAATGWVWGCLIRSNSCANSLGETPPYPPCGSEESLRSYQKGKSGLSPKFLSKENCGQTPDLGSDSCLAVVLRAGWRGCLRWRLRSGA